MTISVDKLYFDRIPEMFSQIWRVQKPSNQKRPFIDMAS